MKHQIEYDILLMKYMNTVLKAEGVIFIDGRHGGSTHPDLELTKEDRDELRLIEKEVKDYNEPWEIDNDVSS